MAITPITALPAAPSISDPTNFETEADALLGAMPTMVTQMNAAFVAFTADAEAAATLAVAAGFSGTSTTSLVVGEGTKSLTVQTARAFVPGVQVIIANTAAPGTNYMFGSVTSYNSGTGALVVEVPVDGSRGSGTYTAWTVSLSGPKGIQGESDRIPARKTANYTALAGDRLECDTTGGAFTITLPASPVTGDKVHVWDGGATVSALGWLGNALTIARNGSTIIGVADDMILRERRGSFTFEYLNSTWSVRRGN